MGLQLYDIVEFLLIQAAAFVIFTFLRLLYYLVLERVFYYNLPLRRYCDEFSKLIRSCFLKIRSLSSLWKNLKVFLENRLTRSFHHLESVPFQKSSGCPTECLLESTSSQDYSINATGDNLQSMLFQDSSRNTTGGPSQSMPYEGSSTNITGDPSQTSFQDSSRRVEDLSQSLPYHNSSSNASRIQSAIPRTSAHSRILRSANRQLLTDNASLRPQKSDLQRNSNVSSSTDQVLPRERYVIQGLGKWYRVR